MIDISSKIASIRVGAGLSQELFAERLGFSRAKVQNIEAGKQRVDHEFLAALAANFSVNLNDLLGGAEGIMVNGSHNASSMAKVIPFYESNGLAERLFKKNEFTVETAWLERHQLMAENVVMLVMSGESMMPKLKNGDLTLVDRTQNQLVDGVCYAVRLGHDVLVKYVQKIAPRIVLLLSANNFYPPCEINLDAVGEEFEIIGRIVGSFQKWQ